MRRILTIARKEYLETVKSRSFLLAVLVPTGIFVALLLVAGHGIRKERTERQASQTAGMPAEEFPAQPGVPPPHDGPRAPSREETLPVRMMTAFAFMFLMFMGIFGTGHWMLASVIEEKSSRVLEVLLSAVSPFELMAGKIVGLAGAGLTFVGIIVCAASLTAAAQGMLPPVSFGTVTYFVSYYVLGFLLMSSVYAAVGSACNTAREAQTLMMPIALLFVAPMAAWHYIALNPNGLAAIILSALPPVTPIVMMLRIGMLPDLPFYEIVLSFIILGASVPVAIWAAAKIFRTGILMYGKPPKLREILRWINQK